MKVHVAMAGVLIALLIRSGITNQLLQPAIRVVCPSIQGKQSQTHVSVIVENVLKNIPFRSGQVIQKQAISFSFSGKRRYHMR